MIGIKKSMLILLTAAAAIHLTGCTKTVRWEEEVPLNTGETVVVKRSGTYVFGFDGAAGTGFGYAPDTRGAALEFTYKGKVYVYTGEAGPMVLAISPSGKPNLVAPANNWNWGSNNGYPCNVPYYVQFLPEENGREWTWPNKIEVWLYNQPTKLSIGVVPMSFDGKKLSASDRQQRTASSAIGFPQFMHVDPTYSYRDCIRSR